VAGKHRRLWLCATSWASIAPVHYRRSKMSLDSQSPTASSNAGSLTLEAARIRYIEHRSMLGSTAQGLYAIERYTADFTAWCALRQVTLVGEVTREVLSEYPRWLHSYRQRNGRPLEATSRLAKLVPLRGWFKWLARSGLMWFDPGEGLELPASVRSLPRNLPSLQDVQAVLAHPELGTATGLRDRAMLELLFATGIRRMEVTQLQLGELDLHRQLLLVRRGKGRKDRMVPMGERATHWLRRYVDQSRPALKPGPGEMVVFLGAGGKPLSLNWLSTLVSGHFRAALAGRAGSCHLLRHAMATMMLEGGADIRYIQLMLGHAQLVTTQIYMYVAIGRLQDVHARCHPSARLQPMPEERRD